MTCLATRQGDARPRSSPESPSRGGRRRLSLTSAAALVTASMIGVGVFTTSGFSLEILKDRGLVMLAWLVAGLLAMCGALSYGALARRLPQSGGEYHFLSRTVHPFAGFLAGWVSLLAGFTAPIAGAALGLQEYLAPVVGGDLRPEWIGTGAIVAAGIMHSVRFQRGVVLQNLAVGLKLALIVGFIAFGLARLPGGTDPVADEIPSTPGLSAFAVSLVWISFSYSGWNAAVYVAGEVRNQKRNLNRSLWLATAVVTLLYLGLNAVFVYSAPVAVLAGSANVAAVAARSLGGERLELGVSVIVALALFTSVSAMIMAGPRVYVRMAEDGFLPKTLARWKETPAAAITLQAALAVVVVWTSGLKELLGYIGFTLGISAAATVVGLFLLRFREGPLRVPIPGYPWVPGTFVVTVLGASGFMIVRKPAEAVAGLLTVALGVPLYFLIRRRWARAAIATSALGIAVLLELKNWLPHGIGLGLFAVVVVLAALAGRRGRQGRSAS